MENTGSISAFIRVRLVSYWADADGNSVRLPAINFDTANWLKDENDIYYYKAPVAPSKLSSVLCNPISLTEKTTADGETVYMVLTVLPEAVQAKPSAAAADAWGVMVADGAISAVN